MNELSLKAYAKLNLALDVLSRLDDGYHAMRMVMQSVGLCDDVRITLRDDGIVRASSDDAALPTDDGNIVVLGFLWARVLGMRASSSTRCKGDAGDRKPQ